MTTTASPNIIAGVIDTWRRFGIFDFILPFLLVFGIVYGILERTQLFGDKAGKSVNAIIAFAIAMTTTLSSWFISFLTGFLPWVSTISIVIITGLMLVAMFAGDFNALKANPNMLKIGGVIVVIALVAVLLGMGAPLIEQLNADKLLSALGLTVMDIWGVVFFIGFIAALFLVGKTGNTGSGGSGSS